MGLGKIIVLNKHHLKLQSSDHFYIGRGSALGNPFTVEQFGRHTVIKKYELWLDQSLITGDKPIVEALDAIANRVLSGQDAHLVCFCKPLKCHGDHIKYVVFKTIAEDEKQ